MSKKKAVPGPISTAPASDVVYLVVALFFEDGYQVPAFFERVWREGVFESEAVAEETFVRRAEEYADQLTAPIFRRAIAVSA